MEKQKMIQLVTAAQAGSQQAISDLFNAYHTDVYNIALRETKKTDTAADVMQESFIEVIQTIGKLQEPAAFMSWLKAITYHQCTRYYRKKENKHEQLLAETEDALTVFDALEEENTEFIPDMALENAELSSTIRNFVENLPDAQRAAIMMKYYDELSVKEIAAVQGVSENTVLSRLYYGRNAIKGEVEAYEKKHNVKLHAIPFLPLLRGAFSEAPKRVAAKTTVAAAKAISTATGVKVTATGVGIAGTVAALPLATKIGAGIAAAAVAIAAIGIGNDSASGSKNTNKSSPSSTNAIVENTESSISSSNNSGLKTFDLFEESFYTIKTSGVNGYGYCNISKTNRDPWYHTYLSYTIDKTEGLSNGDIITITASFNENVYESEAQKFKSNGYYLPQQETKTFVVDDLCVTATKEVIGKELIDKLKKISIEQYIKEDNFEDELENVEVVGVFFVDQLDKSQPAYFSFTDSRKYYNAIHVCVVYDEANHLATNGFVERTVEYVYRNVLIDDIGNVYVEYIDEKIRGWWETYKLTTGECEWKLITEYGKHNEITLLN